MQQSYVFPLINFGIWKTKTKFSELVTQLQISIIVFFLYLGNSRSRKSKMVKIKLVPE